jgi:hypothetical protein
MSPARAAAPAGGGAFRQWSAARGKDSMDRRTLLAMSSFVALIGVLAIATWASLDRAQANETLAAAFGAALD